MCLAVFYSLSLLFYVRLLQSTRGCATHLLFAMTATFAFVRSADQVRPYLTVPFVAVLELWREKSSRRHVAPAASSSDGRSPTYRFLRRWQPPSPSSSFCNLLFNYAGFMTHARTANRRGGGSIGTFEPTPDGRWRLLTTTLWLTRISMGWPLFVASAAGLVIGMANNPRSRHLSTALAVALPAYYFGPINASSSYNYDRFMLPVCVVLALFWRLRRGSTGLIAREAKGGRWRQIAARLGVRLLNQHAVRRSMRS